ncbi:hypothetical protein [Yoonia sp. MH D7]
MKWGVFIVAALLPVSVSAQEFSLPAGCTAYLTVHDRSCNVDHHFTCEADAAGTQRRVSLSEVAMTYMGQIDPETQWLEGYHALNGHTEKLESKPHDRASLSELISTGADDYDFKTLSAEIGETRYVGRDTLTGKTVEIDGVTLEETTYDLTAYAADGSFLWRSKGREFINREWRMFLSGVGTFTTPTEEFAQDSTPMEFIFPGEAGFLSTKPKYGCGVVMSAGPALQEFSNDNI